MKKNHFKIFKIDGVGINLEKFRSCASLNEKIALRSKYKYNSDS